MTTIPTAANDPKPPPPKPVTPPKPAPASPRPPSGPGKHNDRLVTIVAALVALSVVAATVAPMIWAGS